MIQKIFLLIFLIFATNCQFDQSQPIPQTYDGVLIYGSQKASSNYFLLEAFYDLLDPDSASSFALLQKVIEEKNLSSQPNFNMIVHLFPMPININSYPLSMGMKYIYDEFGSSLIIPYLNLIFNSQSKFWYTGNMSQQMVEKSIADFVTNSTDFQTMFTSATFQKALQNSTYDIEVRISWKYACSRNVFETPTYFANGILINNADGYDAQDWQSIFNQFFSS